MWRDHCYLDDFDMDLIMGFLRGLKKVARQDGLTATKNLKVNLEQDSYNLEVSIKKVENVTASDD